jgi:integrase
MSQVYQRGSLRKVKRANGNQVWEWRYRVGGTQKQQMLRVKDFPTRKAVWDHLEHSLSVLNKETERVLPGAVTMGMLADRYIKEYLPDLAKSTRDTWEGVIKLHIKPTWDEVPALAVKPMAVDAWIKRLPLSASSKGRARRLLKQLIDRAMYWELLPSVTNPVKLVKVRGVTKREKKIVLLTPEQATMLIAALEEPYSVVILISACLGLRIEETSALQWEDFNFEARTVEIQRAWTHGEVGDVKTPASEAKLPIPEDLVAALLKYRMRPQPKTSKWLFPSSRKSDAKPRWMGIMMRDHIQPVVERLGLPHIGYHTFRHSFRSWLGSGDAKLSEQKDMMRQSSVAMTLSYGGTQVETMRPHVDAIAAKLKPQSARTTR